MDLEMLKEIADSGKLVIMVTHSEKVASVSSRVVEISDGRIINDHQNPNYKKNKPKILEEKQENSTENKKQVKNFKEKQNLSMWSAIKLSFHNMWASKVKNFLMAFGVAIGIGSLILMMSFSSGITDYINNLIKSYSDPTIVTISKKSESTDPMEYFNNASFTDEEIPTLIENINTYLAEQNLDFTVANGENGNVDYGFGMFTALSDAKVNFSPSGNYIQNEEDPDYDIVSQKIYYLYSIPPYYTQQNVIDGEMSTAPVLDNDGDMIGGGGFMFTPTISRLFGEDEDILGKEVEISFTIGGNKLDFKDTICGVMDTSVMSGFLVVYVDYDYLQYLFQQNNVDFAPTTIYIQTPSEEITNAINRYISTTENYVGSIEEQLANMFNSMLSIIGTSLVVISCISLVVSAMMILVVLYMSVTERTKEIGVLKSIGARRKDIKRIFTSESFLVGVLSGVFGILFNLILTLVVWLVLASTIGLAPISYRWWYFVVALGVSVVISMLAGLYPASKAAKLDPVESLRRE